MNSGQDGGLRAAVEHFDHRVRDGDAGNVCSRLQKQSFDRRTSKDPF